MRLSCGEARGRFEGYARETLPAEERRALREHLKVCGSCRGEAVAGDPLFLFANLPAEALASGEAAGVLEAVRAGIAFKKTERSLGRPARRRRWSAFASAAAALILTLLAPGAPARREASRALEAGRDAVKASFVPAASSSPAPGALEKRGGTQTYPADATIYDWNTGAGEPRVVWIVDRSIDI